VNWAKVDDGFLDHPKVLVAGEEAANLYLRGLIWCCKHLTDGAIPREALRALSSRRDAGALAVKLVSAGLWEAAPDGWRVHDFHDHNPSAAEVKARRSELSAKRAEAGKRGGIRSGQVRGVEANGKQTGSKGQANAEASAEATGSPVPSRPVPYPAFEEKDNTPTREAPQDNAPRGVPAEEVEQALFEASGGALRLSAAPSTQGAAIVRYLRKAGLTRAEMPYLVDTLKSPGAMWAWASSYTLTASWLVGKPHPESHEHECTRLQEALIEARKRHAAAKAEAAERAHRAAMAAEAASRAPMTDADREAARLALRASLPTRKAATP
jgi:hypothetical protein